MLAYNISLYVPDQVKKWSTDMCGQCNSRSACIFMQSDVKATLSADKSLNSTVGI